MITFVVWDNEKLKNLSELEKEEWFDVYNNGLEEDRGYSLTDPNIDNIQTEIKNDYFKFLHEYTRSASLRAYFLLYEDNKIVSMCRVLVKTVLYLEGLETHRDYRNRGYATKLLKEVSAYLKEMNITTLRSNVSIHNTESVALHKKIGFLEYDRTEDKVRFELKIMERPRYYLDFFCGRTLLISTPTGIPYHKDNNRRYYKSALSDIWTSLLFIILIMDTLIITMYSQGFMVYNSILVIVISHFILFFIANILNVLRMIKVSDKQYLSITRKFLLKSLIVISIFAFVALISTLLIS